MGETNNLVPSVRQQQVNAGPYSLGFNMRFDTDKNEKANKIKNKWKVKKGKDLDS